MLQMPSFYCPIEAAESPHTAAAEQETLAWLDRFGLYESPTQRAYFARSRFASFPGKSLPQADARRLALPAKEVMWLQSFDDVYSDEKPGGTPLDEYIVLLGKLSRVLEEPRSRILLEHPWARALRDLRLELAGQASAVQLDRWIEANLAYFDGLLWEAVNRASGRMPSLDDYVAMWLKQSGVYPCIVFTDIACGYAVSAEEWSDPRVRTLREMVAAIIGWDNDLTSYAKEARRAAERGYPAVQNLVAVLAHELGASLAEAAAIAGAMRDRAMVRFLRLRDEVAADGGPTLAHYVHGLGQWIRGYLDYSSQSPRYTDPDNPDDAAIAARRGHGWSIVDALPVPPGNTPALPSLHAWWSP